MGPRTVVTLLLFLNRFQIAGIICKMLKIWLDISKILKLVFLFEISYVYLLCWGLPDFLSTSLISSWVDLTPFIQPSAIFEKINDTPAPLKILRESRKKPPDPSWEKFAVPWFFVVFRVPWVFL